MNILKQCLFIDNHNEAHRQNSEQPQLSIDDLIEDRFSLTNSDSKNKTNNELIDFYLMLYFNAEWLPEVSNNILNKKLELFYLNEKYNKKFELIFISSDRDFESYNKFLAKNQYIRYSLYFKDQNLKVNNILDFNFICYLFL